MASSAVLSEGAATGGTGVLAVSAPSRPQRHLPAVRRYNSGTARRSPRAAVRDSHRRMKSAIGQYNVLERHHPHIVVVHDSVEVDGRPYIVTELIEGETLRQRPVSAPPAAAATRRRWFPLAKMRLTTITLQRLNNLPLGAGTTAGRNRSATTTTRSQRVAFDSNTIRRRVRVACAKRLRAAVDGCTVPPST